MLKGFHGPADDLDMTASVTSLRTDSARTAINRVDESTSINRAEVAVTIHWDGADYTGETSGVPASSQRPLLVAQATLHAVMAAGLRECVAIEASITHAAGTEIALVAVEDPLLTQPLIGTAVIGDGNTQLGFARATLDAVNRRVESDI